jgi:F0F1-type ATP synthase assembly protein I
MGFTAEKNEIDYNSPKYRRSRKAYMAQCTLEYLVSILVADAFLAKLLTDIGISDALTGIISSFISLAFVFQLLSIFLVKKMRNTKKTVLFFDTLSQIFFLSIYAVPFIPLNLKVKTGLIILSVLVAYISKYLIYSIFFKWANSYVSPDSRGEYSAVKEMISLVAGIIFTLLVGFIIDKYESIGNIKGGFLFIAIIMLVLNICNFICIAMIKSDKKEVSKQHEFKTVLGKTLYNRNFVNIIILTALFDTGRYMTLGFLGVFKTKTLLISVGAIQIINMTANIIRLVVSKPFGRYSDKTSFAHGFNLALFFAAIAFGINSFTTPAMWWLIILHTVFYNVSIAGTNQNSFNIIYNYVESDYIIYAMAIKNSIGGLLGFSASLIGGHILNVVQENHNMVFGLSVYGQQILSSISFVIIISAILFNRFVIEKQDIIHQ